MESFRVFLGFTMILMWAGACLAAGAWTMLKLIEKTEEYMLRRWLKKTRGFDYSTIDPRIKEWHVAKQKYSNIEKN